MALDDADLNMVQQAAQSAVEAAMRRTSMPRLAPATVHTYNPDTFQASVLVDGDTEEIMVSSTTGQPLWFGDRVMVLFQPPTGGFIAGHVGRSPAVVSLWVGADWTTVGGGATAYLPLKVDDDPNVPSSPREMFDLESPWLRAMFSGWYFCSAYIRTMATNSDSFDGMFMYEVTGGLTYQEGWQTDTRSVLVNGMFYLDAGSRFSSQIINRSASSQQFRLFSLSVMYLGA